MLTIEIPNLKPISANTLWRRRAAKAVAKAEAFTDAVALLTKSQVKGQRIPEWPLGVVTVFYAPNWITKKKTALRKDVANLEKLVIDGVFKGLGLDDKLIFDNRQIKGHSSRVHTTVYIYTWRGFSLAELQNTLKNS